MNSITTNKLEVKSIEKIANIADLELDFSFSILNSIEVKDKLNNQTNFISRIRSLFKENNLNNSENRSEDHIALRDFKGSYNFSISKEVKEVEVKQRSFVRKFHVELGKGSYEAVIVIGVGGSTLGVNLVCQALEANYNKKVDYLVIDNVDGVFVNKTMNDYDLSRCLFVVSSKTFSTLETLAMAHVFKKELIALMGGGINGRTIL